VRSIDVGIVVVVLTRYLYANGRVRKILGAGDGDVTPPIMKKV
jgi:hypothetical protein